MLEIPSLRTLKDENYSHYRVTISWTREKARNNNSVWWQIIIADEL